MKRFKKHWNKMCESEGGEWIPFENYEALLAQASSSISHYEKITIEADTQIQKLTDQSKTLEDNLDVRHKMLTEKSKVITSQCDELIKKDSIKYKLEQKIINYVAVIWFGLVPTIVGLTVSLFILNWK